MDADSAGEEDGDYLMSDEGNDDEDQSGVSEESLSDDWRPGGGNRRGSKKRGRTRRSGRRPRGGVGDFSKFCQ